MAQQDPEGGLRVTCRHQQSLVSFEMEEEMVRYYSTMRPFGPGTFPQKDGRETITNFDGKIYCEEIGREAWGYIEYMEPLTEDEAKRA